MKIPSHLLFSWKNVHWSEVTVKAILLFWGLPNLWDLSALYHVTVGCHLFLKICRQYLLWTTCSFLVFSLLPSFLPFCLMFTFYSSPVIIWSFAICHLLPQLFLKHQSDKYNKAVRCITPNFRLGPELPYLSFRNICVTSSISSDYKSKSVKLEQHVTLTLWALHGVRVV